MGLGLFIAKTLLERSGARLTFENGGHPPESGASGAVVTVVWPRAGVSPTATARAPLAANAPVQG
jgi:two-component system sensor histidine kinase RegB